LENVKKRVDKRDYEVEHILEWQMLLRFLMGKKGKTNKENENPVKPVKPVKKRRGSGALRNIVSYS